MGALLVSLCACVQILGADDPMRRQLGDPCTLPRDCADGLFCVQRKCAMASGEGGPCTKSADCNDATLFCDFCRCTHCPTAGGCNDFVMCGENCGTLCTIGQPCAAPGDCDASMGFLCDTARGQCVNQNCKNPDGTFQCDITTCAPCSAGG